MQAQRKCLNCQADFKSGWIGNRICPKCKASDAHAEAYVIRKYFNGNKKCS